MAASSDLQLQALQLQIRNLQQKLDWKQININQRKKHIGDLCDATPARAADLEGLERSICRLSLQMEHMQLVIKNPEWSFHTFAMPEKTASSAHTIFVRPPSGNRIEVTIPPGQQPDELFTRPAWQPKLPRAAPVKPEGGAAGGPSSPIVHGCGVSPGGVR